MGNMQLHQLKSHIISIEILWHYSATGIVRLLMIPMQFKLVVLLQLGQIKKRIFKMYC